VTDHGKSQGVRLLDVFLLGPFMIWAGTQQRLPAWAKWGLIGAGIGTITYNAINYARIKKLEG
jgi:hypothetical protein